MAVRHSCKLLGLQNYFNNASGPRRAFESRFTLKCCCVCTIVHSVKTRSLISEDANMQHWVPGLIAACLLTGSTSAGPIQFVVAEFPSETITFVLLFIATLVAFYRLPPRFRLKTLAVSSLIFYAASGMIDFALLIATLALTYQLSLRIRPGGP